MHIIALIDTRSELPGETIGTVISTHGTIAAAFKAHVIVDTGSRAFVPLLHYVLSNEVQAILSQGGHQLVVHTIVTGGQALLDTLHGAAQLVKQMDAARFVIWLNPFWGPVADNGRI
jgi:hypothetical protein